MRILLQVVLSFLLLFTSSAAFCQAKWQLFGEEGGGRVYIDPSYRKEGSIVRVSWISDFEPFRGSRYDGHKLIGSILFESEINCSTRQSRIISRESYPGRVATGTGYGLESVNGPWKSIREEGPQGMVFKAVGCQSN